MHPHNPYWEPDFKKPAWWKELDTLEAEINLKKRNNQETAKLAGKIGTTVRDYLHYFHGINPGGKLEAWIFDTLRKIEEEESNAKR